MNDQQWEMRHRLTVVCAVVALGSSLAFGGITGLAQIATPAVGTPVLAALSPNASVFATGLDNPRGLKFGPDGNLYVAEAGSGGTTPVPAACQQLPTEAGGPYTGGPTARISQIDSNGVRSTIVDNLPSANTANGAVPGVADVEFLGDNLYAVLAGGGCSHGNPTVPNAVLQVDVINRATTEVANLSTFYQNHPVGSPQSFPEPDGVPFSMVHAGTDLYVMDSVRLELDRVDTTKSTDNITRIADYSGALGPIVLATGPAGALGVAWTTNAGTGHLEGDLTAVVAVAFDNKGRLYALEGRTEPTFGPETGVVVRLEGADTYQTIATGLSAPSAMTFGPDGNLYVSDAGDGSPGSGRVVKIILAV